MDTRPGLRELKKAATRQRIADEAANLFAECGFDEVSITDVARAACVSEQTVYNYFPAKHDLALDRAEEIRQRYYTAVSERAAGTSPAAALHVLAQEDVERYRRTDPAEARGEFYALCASSAVVRRFSLALRDEQIETIRAAITETCADVHPAVVHTHASALVSVFQMIADDIGRSVLAGGPPQATADSLKIAVTAAFDDLDEHFRRITSNARRSKSQESR